MGEIGLVSNGRRSLLNLEMIVDQEGRGGTYPPSGGRHVVVDPGSDAKDPRFTNGLENTHNQAENLPSELLTVASKVRIISLARLGSRPPAAFAIILSLRAHDPSSPIQPSDLPARSIIWCIVGAA